MSKRSKEKKIRIVRNAMIGTGAAVLVVSLASVGLVMASDTFKSNKGGNIRVTTLEDPRIKFTDLEFQKEEQYRFVYDSFTFDAEEGDNDGRITASSDSVAHLLVTVNGKIGPATYLRSLTYSFGIPDSVKDGISRNYIEVYTGEDGFYDEGSDPTKYTQSIALSSPDNKDRCAFSLTFGFRWGSYFNYMNPSLYYDDKGLGNGGNLTDEEVLSQMNEFYRVMYYGKNYHGKVASDTKNLPELAFDLNLSCVTRLQ